MSFFSKMLVSGKDVQKVIGNVLENVEKLEVTEEATRSGVAIAILGMVDELVRHDVIGANVRDKIKRQVDAWYASKNA